MHEHKAISRRSFFRRSAAVTAAATGFPYIVPASAFGANDRIAVGVIGCGPQATYVMRNCLPFDTARVTAVCDVNRIRKEDVAKIVNDHYGDQGCAMFHDFRDLLARDDIDAVIIGSPDHWHVLHGIYAARAGKDMYIEKPLALGVEWAKALRAAVHRHSCVFQFGTQQRSSRGFRYACELVINGRIGDLKRIKVGSAASIPGENISETPIPDWIDYDLWLGPAPYTPFSEKRITNEYWWHNTDCALGFVAGWGVHHVDIAQWGNHADDTGPIEVEGTGEFPRDGFRNCATKWNVVMKYANGVVLDYTDELQNTHGITFEGTKGWVYVRRSAIDAYPKSLLNTTFAADEVRLQESSSHIGNFLECIKSRKPTLCNIDVTVRTETICHLSDIAMRLGRKLRWNPHAELFIDDDEANRMLSRPMRDPWRL